MVELYCKVTIGYNPKLAVRLGEGRVAQPDEHVVLAEGAPAPPALGVGLYPIITLQYSSTTLYQVSCHIQ